MTRNSQSVADFDRGNSEGQRTATASMLNVIQDQIQSGATEILNQASTRRMHPNYGVTLTGLRYQAARLDGMVAVYAVVTGEAGFHTSPAAFDPRFEREGLADLVHRARTAVREA